MKWRTYIYEHTVQWCLVIFIIFSIEIFLLTTPIPMGLRFYIAISLIIGYFLCSYMDYKKKALDYQAILQQLERLDQKYLLPEVIDKKNNQESVLLQEIFYAMEHSMIDQVNQYKRINQEYKEYVELWIHEVKMPIATSKLILENHPSEISHSLEEELTKIEGYVEQALFYARSASVEKDFIIKEVNLHQIIMNVIKKNKKEFIYKKIKVSLEDVDYMVYSDIKWVDFILTQIVNNALKYTLAGGEVYFKAKKYSNKVILMIKDNGIGIPPEDLFRVFDKGFTGSNQRSNQKSTGIGLYLCYKLCHRLDIGIHIESVYKQGTSLYLTFPISNMTKM